MTGNICPLCGGLGAPSARECAICHGTSEAVTLGGKVLYWGEKIDASSNLLFKVESAVRKALNLALIIFGALGLLFLLYSAYVQGFEVLLSAFFWRRPTLALLIFWISVWGDLYLVYRILRESELLRPIARKAYEEDAVEAKTISWQEASGIKKSLWTDVSRSYTKNAAAALRFAYNIAHGSGHSQVDLIHIFAGLLATDEAALIFSRLGLKGDELREKVKRVLATFDSGHGEASFTSAAIDALYRAYALAYQTRKDFVDAAILLQVVTRAESKAKEILYDMEVDERKIKNVIAWHEINQEMQKRYRTARAVIRRRPTHEAGRAMTAVATPFLDKFGEDITLAARYGRLAPTVGREKEIKSIFRVLESSRASVVLVGNPGVGKDAIVEGIAQRMAEEEVPKILKDKRLVSLSLPRLIAGGSGAEAAEKLYRLLNEIVRAKNIVLYIPNIHEVAGNSELGEALAAELSKHYFLALSSTNPAGYKSLQSGALASILEKVEVPEPDLDDTIQILESKAGLYEYKNKVFFSYDSVERAAALADKYLPDRFLPEKAIEVLQEVAHAVRSKRGEGALVGGEDVAEIISEKSHVPVTKVTEAESEKLLNLEERMAGRVVGQKEAIKAVASAIRRAAAGLRAGARPIANFLFLGPTGVGKTETAKTVAEIYFGNEENMIRLDMSEYQDQASLYRMIGEPGRRGGGLLTEAVRKQPFALLLLDEIEKAHPDILNIFLQVMDDGRLTDNEGRTVDFSNVILIATSNAGTQVIQDEMKKGTGVEEVKNLLINKELRNYFRPEFLNRFDGIIVFTPLSEKEIRQVARLMLNAVAKQLEEKGVTLRVTDEAVAELAAAGFDPTFGARPLRRVIQERVQDALANFLLQKKIGRRDIVVLGSGGEITIEKASEL